MTKASASEVSEHPREFPAHRVCVHIGLPKTATTMLQKHLFQHHPQVVHAAHPIKFVTYDAEGRTARFIDEICNATDWDGAFCDNYANESLKFAEASGKALVVSEESISFNGIIDQGLQASNLVDRLERVRRLKQALPDARIVFVIRRPVDWVRSIYLQRLKGYGKKRNTYESLDDWTRAHWEQRDRIASVVSNIRYGELALEYAEHFGRENVGVFLFEQLIEDSERFVHDLAGFMGIDADVAVRLTGGQRENESMTKRQLLASHLRASSKLGRFAIESPYLKPLRRLASTILPGKELLRPEMAPELQAMLEDHCRADLKRLAETWKLPLSEFGYPV
jgi:hypothetical protein